MATEHYPCSWILLEVDVYLIAIRPQHRELAERKPCSGFRDITYHQHSRYNMSSSTQSFPLTSLLQCQYTLISIASTFPSEGQISDH